MNQLRAMLFDLDGTLCNTVADVHRSINRTREEMGLVPLTQAELMVGINDAGSEFVRKCLPEEMRHDEDLLAKVFERYCEIYDAGCCEETTIFPGMLELVLTLKNMGVRTAVYTNKPHSQAERIIEKLFPKEAFDFVLGYGKFPAKPDPTAALWLMEQFGTTPEQTGYVGDSDTDMLTSLNAGTFTIGVDWGYRPPELLAEKGAEFIARGNGMAILALFDQGKT